MHIIKIYTSPLPFPLCFAQHSWIVILDGTSHERYEIHRKKNKKTGNYLYRNNQPISQGMNKRFWKTLTEDKFHYDGICIHKENITEDIVRKIKAFIKQYQHSKYYRHYPGPNSNTFIQNIIDQFDIDCILPRNAFGKDYK